jgi:hypothetical protein
MKVGDAKEGKDSKDEIQVTGGTQWTCRIYHYQRQDFLLFISISTGGSWNHIDFSDIEIGDQIGGGGVGIIYKGISNYLYIYISH